MNSLFIPIVCDSRYVNLDMLKSLTNNLYIMRTLVHVYEWPKPPRYFNISTYVYTNTHKSWVWT